MIYGDKRDYRKIDIYTKDSIHKKEVTYRCLTTWSPTCGEAKERYAEKHQLPLSQIKAYFASKN